MYFKTVAVAGLVVALLGGCSAGLNTKVRTLSDTAPVAGASYALILTEAQSADIIAKRQALAVRANLMKLGFVEESANDAAYHVHFVVTDTGSVEKTGKQSRLGIYYPPTHTTRQATVAGLGVPGTQQTTVHSGVPVSYGGEIETGSRNKHAYRAEISFLEHDSGNTNPVYKIVAETRTQNNSLNKIDSCLIDAAFRSFPASDGSLDTVNVDKASCS